MNKIILLHERFQGLYLPLSTESPLRLISHKCTFLRRTQIIWNLLIELMNDSPPSYPFLLYKKTAQGKCSINLDMTNSALRRQGQRQSSAQLSSERSCFKKSISRAHGGGLAGWGDTAWGSPTYSTALKKVPHVGQISNKFKIEQALLREGVPTDAGFCYQKSIYISLQP